MSSTSSGPQRPTIYVCDPSAEATKTESALTQAGYDVIDVPRHRLVERVRLEFGHRILNQHGQLLLEAETVHACTSREEKPRRLPPELVEKLKRQFKA